MSVVHQDWSAVKFTSAIQTNNPKKVTFNKAHTPELVVNDAPKQLGQLIAQARLTQCKNQKQFATTIGVSQLMLARWEANKEAPNNAQIACIEKHTKVKLPRCKKTVIIE
jgi:DNA-binding transcriptional regulator YiaG